MRAVVVALLGVTLTCGCSSGGGSNGSGGSSGADASTGSPPSVTAGSRPEDFGDPRRVVIRGYSGHAMEPFISADGTRLVFNNANDPAVDTNLHWAERIDDLTFQYRGEVDAANSPSLDGVPALDADDNFYFITTRSHAADASTVYRGRWSAGTVSGIQVVAGLAASAPGRVVFDVGVSRDGRTLYIAEGDYRTGSLTTANLIVARRDGPGFTRDADSDTVLRQVNAVGGTQYAAAISDSGLELFFTRLEGSTPAIHAATRSATDRTFGTPVRLQALDGFVEAPALASDGKALYYHKLENGLFAIFRATRP